MAWPLPEQALWQLLDNGVYQIQDEPKKLRRDPVKEAEDALLLAFDEAESLRDFLPVVRKWQEAAKPEWEQVQQTLSLFLCKQVVKTWK